MAASGGAESPEALARRLSILAQVQAARAVLAGPGGVPPATDGPDVRGTKRALDDGHEAGPSPAQRRLAALRDRVKAREAGDTIRVVDPPAPASANLHAPSFLSLGE